MLTRMLAVFAALAVIGFAAAVAPSPAVAQNRRRLDGDNRRHRDSYGNGHARDHIRIGDALLHPQRARLHPPTASPTTEPISGLPSTLPPATFS